MNQYRAKLVNEDIGGVSAPMSTTMNVPGMGNVVPGTASTNNIGSGDNFGHTFGKYTQKSGITKKKKKKKLSEENINPYDGIAVEMAKKLKVKIPFQKVKSKTNQNKMIVKESLYNFKRDNDAIYGSGLGKKHLIEKFLDSYEIKNYVINDDFTIDVNGNVDLRPFALDTKKEKLDNLPEYIQFNKITNGYFTITSNNLTSLRGCPKYVSQEFCCNNNKLESLEYCPEYVGSVFYCDNNIEKFTEEYVNSLCNVKGRIEC